MKQTQTLLMIILIAGLILILPYSIRLWQGNSTNVIGESYEHIRLYNTIDGKFFDSLQGRNVMLNIIYLIPIKGASAYLVTKVLMIVLGILTILLSYALIKKSNINEKNMWIILLLLITSPVYIHIFTDFNMQSIVLFLTLACIYFFVIKKSALSAICFVLIPFIDVYASIISLILILLYLWTTGEKHEYFTITALVTIIASIAINSVLGFSVWNHMPIYQTNAITDISGEIGYSFSVIILAFIGIVLLWHKSWKNLMINFSILALLVLSVFNDTLKIFMSIVLIIYAAFAFMYLTKRKWSIQIIKKITIILIVCSILFTSLIYITKSVNSKPDSNYVDALTFLNKQSLPDELVLSTPDNGYIIQYYAKRQTYLDDSIKLYQPERMKLFANITTSRNLEKTETFLQQKNIKYLFIDNDFKKYLEENEGMLFLINTSNKFQSVYKNNNLEVWMYMSNDKTLQ